MNKEKDKVKDWVNQWIEQFGTKKADDDVLLIIFDGEKTIYEGHFLDVPKNFYDYKVFTVSNCLASTDKRRIGAYWLEVLVPFDCT